MDNTNPTTEINGSQSRQLTTSEGKPLVGNTPDEDAPGADGHN